MLSGVSTVPGFLLHYVQTHLHVNNIGEYSWIRGIIAWYDDIFMLGTKKETRKEHKETVTTTLTRVNEMGFKIDPMKCT